MNTRKPLILIVEDDVDTARLNARMLKRHGYDVITALNAAEALTAARDNPPDLFVLDVVLPDGDGLTLCRQFRMESDAPVIFLTGRKATHDIIEGLTTGGDYYLTKPYNIDEFLAVVDRLLARTRLAQEKVAEASVIERGPLKLMIPERTVLLKGRDVELTPKEFAVLLLLVQNENAELSSQSIYEHVWHTKMNHDSGALRVQIARLKKKLDEENTDEFSLIYKQGKGYSFITK